MELFLYNFAPTCGGNADEVILYEKSAPVCGGSVGEADKGGYKTNPSHHE